MDVETIIEMMNHVQNQITQLNILNLKVKAQGPREDRLDHLNPGFTVTLDNDIIVSHMIVWSIGLGDFGAFDRSKKELIINDNNVTIHDIQDINKQLKKIIGLYASS